MARPSSLTEDDARIVLACLEQHDKDIATVARLFRRVSTLCHEYGVTIQSLIRLYDVGKYNTKAYNATLSRHQYEQLMTAYSSYREAKKDSLTFTYTALARKFEVTRRTIELLNRRRLSTISSEV